MKEEIIKLTLLTFQLLLVLVTLATPPGIVFLWSHDLFFTVLAFAAAGLAAFWLDRHLA